MLPNEIAPNPEEETQQPNSQGKGEDDGDSPTPTPTDVNIRKKMGITFDDATASEPASQSSSTYKDLLSQPASTLTHRNRLLWLQKRRAVGLWVQCDDCDRWRHLTHVLEAQELPAKWRCTMNPDKSYANCSVPEAPLRVRDEEDLIHNEYTAGSIVWARLAGWPWWPAMVDDDVDTEQFYWLDGFSDIPTYYNVTFFDENEATHAWIAPNQLKPYDKNRDMAKQVAKGNKYKKRLGAALTQAEDACRLSQQQRLAKYSFITRYSGNINSPKKVTKKELKRFNDRFKKRYNVQLQMECASESEDEYLVASKRKKKEPVKQNKIVSGKGKKIKDTVEKTVKVSEKRNAKHIDNAEKILTDKPDTSNVEKTVKDKADKRNANEVDRVGNAISEKPETSKNVQYSQDVPQISRPENAMKTEQIPEMDKEDIGIAVNEISNEDIATETVPDTEGSLFDNDTSDTYVPPKDLPTQSTYTEDTQRQDINSDDTETPPVPEDSDLTLAETPKTGRPQDIIFGRNLEDSMQQFEVSQSRQDACTPPARFKPVFKPVFKTPNSLSVQVGTHDATKASTLESVDNDTSKNYVPDTESESESMESSLRETIKKIRTRATSGGSDDFDF